MYKNLPQISQIFYDQIVNNSIELNRKSLIFELMCSKIFKSSKL